MHTAQESPVKGRNNVTLAGRVSSAPVERELPSGDRVVTFRIVMPREPTAMTARSKQVSDWVDCAAWSGRARRSVGSWQVDDRVEVEGALRRRFFRGEGGAASRVEVEVLSARRLGRASR
jgi:single-strand DNA-binding protein